MKLLLGSVLLAAITLAVAMTPSCSKKKDDTATTAAPAATVGTLSLALTCNGQTCIGTEGK